jgi:hypothetical protein
MELDYNSVWESPLIIHPDMTWEDISQEWDKMIERNRQVQRLADKQITADELCQFLESQDINIDAYLNQIGEEIGLITKQGVEVT